MPPAFRRHIRAVQAQPRQGKPSHGRHCGTRRFLSIGALWCGVMSCVLAAPVEAQIGAQAHPALAVPDSPPVRHLLYGELFGNALYLGSVNYEAMLTRRLSARVGASPFGAFPVMLNYLVPDGRHRLEAGAGVLATRTGVAGTATLGYRHQPPAQGMIFRAGLTPWVGRGGVAWWGGISIGAAW